MKLLVLVTLVMAFGFGSCDIGSDINQSLNDLIRLKKELEVKTEQLDQLKQLKDKRQRDIQHLKTGPTYCDCRWTGYLNEYDEQLDFVIPDRRLIRGLKSEYSGWYLDRRWMVQYCKIC